MSQLPADRRETWITGIGLVSSLGDGLEANWDALRSGRVNIDLEKYAPWMIHPLAPLNLDSQIPKKGDQRQMEAWQRIGTYAAGLALDSAGIKGNTEILARTDMIVAAGGGERDIAADTAILSGLPAAEKPEAFLNERLMSDLRPTLFLAQLSNLLAGNISIVHGVTGSSRTFMGEEAAGIDAVRIALSRIAAGQSKLALVGGAHNAERKDLLLLYEFGGFVLKNLYQPVWSRRSNPGFARAFRPHRPGCGRGNGGAAPHVGTGRAPAPGRPLRCSVRGNRGRAADRRGAELPGRAPRSGRSRDRQPYRARHGRAVPDEHCPCGPCGAPWHIVPAVQRIAG